MTSKWMAEFARALRNFRYERSPTGIYFPGANATFGGVIAASFEHGPWEYAGNATALQGLDKMLTDWFSAGTPPTGFYLAPYTNNVAPSSALTAANFTATQAEYTGYTQSTRGLWVPDGASSDQVMSNSNTPIDFTAGASTVTLRGAGFIAGASAKGSTSGTMVACAAFDSPYTLPSGSTISLKYYYGANPS